MQQQFLRDYEASYVYGGRPEYVDGCAPVFPAQGIEERMACDVDAKIHATRHKHVVIR